MTTQYIQYLDLPKIPTAIIDNLPRDLSRYSLPEDFISRFPFVWSKDFNHEFNEWCKKNICADMFFAMQAMTCDQPRHRDRGSLTKLNYVFETGGDQVLTKFWSSEDPDAVLLGEYCIMPYRWHIFKADAYHSVENITPGRQRMAITSRVF